MVTWLSGGDRWFLIDWTLSQSLFDHYRDKTAIPAYNNADQIASAPARNSYEGLKVRYESPGETSSVNPIGRQSTR